MKVKDFDNECYLRINLINKWFFFNFHFNFNKELIDKYFNKIFETISCPLMIKLKPNFKSPHCDKIISIYESKANVP